MGRILLLTSWQLDFDLALLQRGVEFQDIDHLEQVCRQWWRRYSRALYFDRSLPSVFADENRRRLGHHVRYGRRRRTEIRKREFLHYWFLRLSTEGHTERTKR